MADMNINSALMVGGFMLIGGLLGVEMAENHCGGESGAIKEICLEYASPPYFISGALIGTCLGLLADYMLNYIEF